MRSSLSGLCLRALLLACAAYRVQTRRAQISRLTTRRLQRVDKDSLESTGTGRASSSAISVADSEQKIPLRWRALLAALPLASPASGFRYFGAGFTTRPSVGNLYNLSRPGLSVSRDVRSIQQLDGNQGLGEYAAYRVRSRRELDLDQLTMVLREDVPAIWRKDPDWDIVRERLVLMSAGCDSHYDSVADESGNGSLSMGRNETLQVAKARALWMAAALSDLFEEPEKVAIGMAAIFGQPLTAEALYAMANAVNSSGGAIHDPVAGAKAFEEAQAVVHNFSKAVVNAAASFMLMPKVCKKTLSTIRHTGLPKVALKKLVQALSLKVGIKYAAVLNRHGSLGAALLSPAVRLTARAAYGIYGLLSSKQAVKLQRLWEKNPRLILAVVERDMKDMFQNLSKVGDMGKAYFKRLIDQRQLAAPDLQLE